LDWGKDKIDEGVKRVNFHFGVTEDSLNQLLRLGVVGHEVIEKRFFDTSIFDLAHKNGWLLEENGNWYSLEKTSLYGSYHRHSVVESFQISSKNLIIKELLVLLEKEMPILQQSVLYPIEICSTLLAYLKVSVLFLSF